MASSDFIYNSGVVNKKYCLFACRFSLFKKRLLDCNFVHEMIGRKKAVSIVSEDDSYELKHKKVSIISSGLPLLYTK